MPDAQPPYINQIGMERPLLAPLFYSVVAQGLEILHQGAQLIQHPVRVGGRGAGQGVEGAVAGQGLGALCPR